MGSLMNDEVISPELVLVDPELAQIARRRLPDVTEWRPQPLPQAPSVPLIVPARRRSGRHPTIGVRALAAATTLLLLGPLVVPNMGGALLQRPAVPAVPTTFEVEARTLALLQDREGARSAPAGVLDKGSGLLTTSAYIVCARVGRTSLFDCRLGLAHAPGRTWLLTVAVSGDGTEKLTWNGSVAVP
jgi:hypothetical protein